PKAAIYARVSTTGNGQDVGLQLDELRQVARQRGWKVVNEYATKQLQLFLVEEIDDPEVRTAAEVLENIKMATS
ncbi:MAG: recombinase family protein, partial [Proteobacteria bacterium]|nr:recombinase family protein [Pseudomonadota bacterium]